jgi:8-oxo-dGTP diphosphatase
MNPKKIIEVAAAVLVHADGTVLLAQRPVGKAYEGYWEFPGGKIEPGESPHQALCRELHEELGIEVVTAHPWLTREFTYPHATVRLHFFRVFAWQGDPHGCERQMLSWQLLPHLSVTPILPANEMILRALSLPNVYAISNVATLGCDEFMRRLELALQNGLRMLQVREKKLIGNALVEFSSQVVRLAHRYEAKVLINNDEELADRVGADGVHYTSSHLMSCLMRPASNWCAASCHNAAELSHAAELGFDFALLSPVLPTLSHPDTPHLGWERFSELVVEAKLPVYALGGLTVSDLNTAQQYGAHGISLLSQAW